MANDKYETDKYAGDYSDSGLMSKVKNAVKSAGLSVVYQALQLFYIAKNPNVPMHIRAAVVAPLGYFISPVDFIPDIVPVTGYIDDATVLRSALGAMAQWYATDDIKQQAKDTLRQLFGDSAVRNLD